MTSARTQVVRYKKDKQTFEVLTNPGSVLKFREGKLGWDKVLATDVVFTNSSRGDRARDGDVM